MKKTNAIVLIFILLLSCEEAVPPTEAEKIAGNRAEIQLSLDSETYELSISTNKNFADASFLQFTLVYNYDRFSIAGYEKGDCNLVWTNLDEANLVPTRGEFIFSSVSDSKDLITINFSPSGNYEGMGFYLEDIIIKDNDLNSIYYSCTISSYADPVQCRNAGGIWAFSEEFYPQSLCYKDEAPEGLELDGEFAWIKYYCD